MIRNQYRERWAEWLPSALRALANDPPDFPAVMPAFPLPNDDLRVALISSSVAYDTKIQAPFTAAAPRAVMWSAFLLATRCVNSGLR